MGDDMSEWISVKDRLPDTEILFKGFLVYDNLNNKVSHDYWNNEQLEWNHYQQHVTHWMPLPDAPTIFTALTPENRTDYEIQT